MVYIKYENLPDFCQHYSAVGHDIQRYKFFNREDNCNEDDMSNARTVGRRRTTDRRWFVEREANNEPVVVSKTSEQLHNMALNEILEAYEDIFAKDNHPKEKHSWAYEMDSIDEEDGVSHVLATPCMVEVHQTPAGMHTDG